MKLLELKTKEERAKLLEQVVKPFTERAFEHDKNISFPFENFKDLINIGYHTLTIPKEYGGAEIPLTEMLYYQQIIGAADGSTALSIGWHMGIMKHLGENKVWKEDVYRTVVQNVIDNGALINNAATEPATGSPTRGGRPETFAKKDGKGWIINGRKSFATLSPILSYIVVSASIDGTDDVGNFLIKRESAGVSIEETWDSVAMRASGSHDVVLENVRVDEDDLVEIITPGKKKPAGWLLHIPACYLGIAHAAKQRALEFATTYSPNSIKGTISDIPTVRQRIGEMELNLLEANHFLYSIAKKWDEADEETRSTMGPELGAVKLSVVNKALHVVDLAMRIVGARSLSETNHLQRYYRDVRAGLHNPPMDDMTIMNLAAKAINDFI